MNHKGRILQVNFAEETKFEAAINVVRALSEGTISRDPAARLIQPDPPKPKMKPLSVVRPISRGSVKWQKWCLRKAEAMGKTMVEFNAWRSQQMSARYRKKKMA